MSSKRCLLITVHGRVQGVFFRHRTKQEADRLGVTGWVRNMPDGTVAALICGDEKQLDAMTRWLRLGPEMARVDSVDVQPTNQTDPPDTFQVAF
jgi:acylphosphatase